MSAAYQCDYCHEFTMEDAARGKVACIPKAKNKHSGGAIQYEMFVDGVKANACNACAIAHLGRLTKALESKS